MAHHFRWFFRLVTCQAKNFTARVTNGWHDLFEPLKTYHGFTHLCWKSLRNLNHGRNLVRLEMRSQRQRPFPRVAGVEFETKCSFGMTSELKWILYKGPLFQLGESEVVEDSELRRKMHGIVFWKSQKHQDYSSAWWSFLALTSGHHGSLDGELHWCPPLVGL